eukprot:749481-Hanusia_phi.AAC.17
MHVELAPALPRSLQVHLLLADGVRADQKERLSVCKRVRLHQVPDKLHGVLLGGKLVLRAAVGGVEEEVVDLPASCCREGGQHRVLAELGVEAEVPGVQVALAVGRLEEDEG